MDELGAVALGIAVAVTAGVLMLAAANLSRQRRPIVPLPWRRAVRRFR